MHMPSFLDWARTSCNTPKLFNMEKTGKEEFIAEVHRRLKRRYASQMRTSLDHSSPWELLVATILSAQAQDSSVNLVTPKLFRAFRHVNDFAKASPSKLYPYVRSIGLYRTKSRSIVNSARMVMSEYSGKVPESIEDLMKLPGVGRKTANVVLSNAFGINSGIAIDTHCITVSNRLGIARTRKPEAIEKVLMKYLPRSEWANISHLLIALGRDVCTARAKHCEGCVLNDICPSSTTRRKK